MAKTIFLFSAFHTGDATFDIFPSQLEELSLDIFFLKSFEDFINKYFCISSLTGTAVDSKYFHRYLKLNFCYPELSNKGIDFLHLPPHLPYGGL
jgi:hypothetical protein